MAGSTLITCEKAIKLHGVIETTHDALIQVNFYGRVAYRLWKYQVVLLLVLQSLYGYVTTRKRTLAPPQLTASKNCFVFPGMGFSQLRSTPNHCSAVLLRKNHKHCSYA